MDKTAEQLEHIEHTQHAAHASRFDRFVAVSMAIIAALLAAVTMLSHRAHNDTLRLQTEANMLHTQATDEWGYYQAKNIRKHAYQTDLVFLDILTKQSGSEERQAKAKADWQKQLDDYKRELPDQQKKAESLVADARHQMEASEKSHHMGNRFDLAELGVELGLVLCSLAVLTKRPPFWYGGLSSALLGLLLAVSAYTMH